MTTTIICRECNKKATTTNTTPKAAVCKNYGCDSCNSFWTIGSEGTSYDLRRYDDRKFD